MSKLYSENTTIVWNGNLVKGGSAKVTEFFNNLPATEHTLHSLDCQPVSDQAIPGQTTVLVVVEGLVKYDGLKMHRFSQNFLLTAEGGTLWKVASDCFRFIEWKTCLKSTTFFWSQANIYSDYWFLYKVVLHVCPYKRQDVKNVCSYEMSGKWTATSCHCPLHSRQWHKPSICGT